MYNVTLLTFLVAVNLSQQQVPPENVTATEPSTYINKTSEEVTTKEPTTNVTDAKPKVEFDKVRDETHSLFGQIPQTVLNPFHRLFGMSRDMHHSVVNGTYGFAKRSVDFFHPMATYF